MWAVMGNKQYTNDGPIESGLLYLIEKYYQVQTRPAFLRQSHNV